MRYFFLLFWSSTLFSSVVDFDVVVIGTSPFSLVEALYRYHSGDSVLILEQSDICGGAWKSLTVCGIEHADLGCHQIGNDPELLQFFEDYLGCKMVSLENPLFPYTPSEARGYYFSGGCYECIDHLLQLIQQTEIVLLMNHRLQSVKINPSEILATIKTNGLELTTSKIIAPTYADIRIENHPTIPLSAQGRPKSKFQHLYILIEDSLPDQFTYCENIGQGISRMMNLTHFTHLTGTGQQLIVFQFHGEITKDTPQEVVSHLQARQFLSRAARILSYDAHIYEQSYFDQNLIYQTANGMSVFEILSTAHIFHMSQYLLKWKSVLKPYEEAMRKTIDSKL